MFVKQNKLVPLCHIITAGWYQVPGNQNAYRIIHQNAQCSIIITSKYSIIVFVISLAFVIDFNLQLTISLQGDSSNSYLINRSNRNVRSICSVSWSYTSSYEAGRWLLAGLVVVAELPLGVVVAVWVTKTTGSAAQVKIFAQPRVSNDSRSETGVEIGIFTARRYRREVMPLWHGPAKTERITESTVIIVGVLKSSSIRPSPKTDW